eukprot:GHVH01004563.1.p1 GENE.GHVH01004563.1~~GHVH01004563.1.p1  ORF type:complete len:510 (+),score=79.42 GHVH01004563.1:1439-2968(+)
MVKREHDHGGVKREHADHPEGSQNRKSSKKQKQLHRDALEGQGWLARHDIQSQIDHDETALESKEVVKSILHEDDEGGIVNQTGKFFRITQEVIKEHIQSPNIMKMVEPIRFAGAGKRASEGPYKAVVSRNGAHLVVAGKKGHLKLLDLMRDKEVQETKFIRQRAQYKDLWSDSMHLNQTIRDVCFLSSYEMTAVATKSAVQIYSDTGHDMHRLASLGTVTHMDYLPHHFLLSTVDTGGNVKFTDMGANGGEIVAKISQGIKGTANALRVNPQTAVTAIANARGVVQMFTPSEEKCVVETFCQHGGVRDLAFSLDGSRFVTTSDQGHIKVWDGRKTFEPIASYKVGAGRATYVSISQTDQIAVAGDNHVMVWDSSMLKGAPGVARHPILTHSFQRGQSVHSLCFRPFYDVLYVGSENGVNPLIAPGSGIATVDSSSDLNPYITKKARRNMLVKSLLERLPPESIALDPEALTSLNPKAEIQSDSYSSEESSSTSDDSTSDDSASGDSAK